MSYDCGIVGLGVMGANLALNIAEKGFRVAVFNRTFATSEAFIEKNKAAPFAANLAAFPTIEAFVASLIKPRKVFILVQAGGPTDSTIQQLRKAMEANDVIVDTGNAHFKDQARRAEELEAAGLRFLGMGISGGEEGARKGPAFFPGGTLSVWEEIRPIIEAASAKADDGRPCVTMNGSGGAGSCVKMYHNAGEYAILQIWGEVFDVLRAYGMDNETIARTLEGWKARGFLASYMLDISIEAAKAKEADGGYLTERVKDRIGSKGTGLWSVQEALEVGVPAPSLGAAVYSRQLTMYKSERETNAAQVALTAAPKASSITDPNAPEVEDLYQATLISIIACYAQMFQCLRELDNVYKFGLNLPATIATFRAGCILKGYLLKPMTVAFEQNPNLSNLMVAFSKEISEGINGYRRSLGKITVETSVAVPVLSASLVYVNAMFSSTLRYGQLVSLQRDVFGRHGFERLDREGKDSFQWPELQ
ncbi:6-phosphogluconate dehydrogenase decarboxylating, putative [Bodo saltans]|uniref:6-phosphogluconate dehydrogenase, decarboxylating n=1 Tax=Bodo saltans TaxID=75058 RepID=A0A0S4JHR8_BODSA|nr:6-phosphogluconate dehydrogenase decarboxylating, putative [Bodo saltans]|eukprot:CUG89551.1 6-phosphogluconate dehydrogenase decarboxylating, putative [Bodo saltans]